MSDNNIPDAIDTFMHKLTTDFKISNSNINGVLITNTNGLIFASRDVTNDCGGSIALLADLASTLFERPAIVCLEKGDQKIIIREAGKKVLSIYTEVTRR